MDSDRVCVFFNYFDFDLKYSQTISIYKISLRDIYIYMFLDKLIIRIIL